MASARAKCTMEEEEVLSILRKTLGAKPIGRAFQSDGMEYVVQEYQALLCQLACSTSRLSANVLISPVADWFSCSHHQAKQFSNAIVDGYMYCKNKSNTMTSGKKISAPVKNVVACMGMSSPQKPDVELPLAAGTVDEVDSDPMEREAATLGT